jgi:hypothetical protein
MPMPIDQQILDEYVWTLLRVYDNADPSEKEYLLKLLANLRFNLTAQCMDLRTSRETVLVN